MTPGFVSLVTGSKCKDRRKVEIGSLSPLLALFLCFGSVRASLSVGLCETTIADLFHTKFINGECIGKTREFISLFDSTD